MTITEIDYGDFKINVQIENLESRELKDAASKIGMETSRRERMFTNKIISKEAFRAYEKEASFKLSKLYATYIIFGWTGKFKGDDLGKYDIEKAAKLLSEPMNLPLLLDIIEVVKALVEKDAEKENEIDGEEIKN